MVRAAPNADPATAADSDSESWVLVHDSDDETDSVYGDARDDAVVASKTAAAVAPARQLRNSKAVPAVARRFLDFVNAAPSPFHAVEEAVTRLEAVGFQRLRERDCWDGQLAPNGKYYFTRNRSALIAFVVGGEYKPGNGFALVGAHTDSPCLKLKPVSKKQRAGYLQVGVQTYGGGLWSTWFDRDLGVAGRVMVESEDGKVEHKLVKIAHPILRVPTLAIHLDRGAGDGHTFNKETHLTPVLCSAAAADLNAQATPKSAKHHSVLLSALAAELNCAPEHITDLELCLFDTNPAVVGGALSEYVFAPRCDNLMMSYTAVEALTLHAQADAAVAADTGVSVIALFDNEEVGSLSAYGADSHLLESVLRRITSAFANDVHGAGSSAFEEAVQRSYLISADMAHAVHPNYAEKHEDLHQPQMNAGVVIKHNANQRYATTAPTTAILRKIAARAAAVELDGEEAGEPVALQEFVVRNDSPCGSTIGPILSGKLGLRTIDIGNPQLSMHSIREQAGVQDIGAAVKLFTSFFANLAEVDALVTVD